MSDPGRNGGGRSSGERNSGGQSSGLPPRRLMWLFAIKIALLAFAVLVALKIYGLI